MLKEAELDIKVAVKKLLPLISTKYGLVEKILRVVHYSDEPKFFKFITKVGNPGQASDGNDYKNTASGFSFSSEEEALLKCIGESVERFSLKVYKKKDLILGSFGELKSQACNPKLVVAFSDKQKRKKGFKKFIFNNSSKFFWVNGFSLVQKRRILIPAQLIYTSYIEGSKEPIIRFPISSGAAGGTSLSGALCRGIYEVIERDAFMISYLNKLKSPMVNLDGVKDVEISKILSSIKRYRLKAYTFDITTDLEIYTFLTVIVDKTDIGPSITVGLKSHLEPKKAIVGSIQEALHTRAWIRREVENNPNQLKKVNPKRISSLKERGIFWYPKKRIRHLNFLLKQSPISKRKYDLNQSLSVTQQLEVILKKLRRKKYDLFYVDIGFPLIKKFEYEVVKVIIPQLQPLFLDERYPYFGGRRLYTLPRILGFYNRNTQEHELNKYPHPFL